LTVFTIWRTWGSRPASGYAGDRANDLASGDLYILSVGVEPRLTAKGKRDPYAGDAWFVRQALAQAEPLYATTHARVLAGPRANRDEVLEALAWLGKSVGERDVAVLFFSTHGSIAPRGRAPKEGFYIDLAGAGVSKKNCVLWGSELHSALGKVRGRTALLLDTCSASGIIPADGSKVHQAAVVASCAVNESSSGQWERTDRPHGWFVIALCEALDGMADTNGDGVVTLAEVTFYLPARAKRLYDKQNAVSLLGELFDLPLARIDRNRPAVTLWTPKPPKPARNRTGEPDTRPH
jgi:hypothetical protein